MFGEETSSTPPSNVFSRLKKLRKVTCAEADVIGIFGVSRSLSVTTAGSSITASLGAVSGVVVDVTHNGAPPIALVATHPAGNAGAVTPSKFSVNEAHGVTVGVGVGGGVVAVAVGVGEGVPVDVAVAVGVGPPIQSVKVIVSMRQPWTETLLSLAIRHRSTMF